MFRFPEKIHAALIAPSGTINEQAVLDGKSILERSGCTVTVMPHLFDGANLPYLSANDDMRAEDFNNAISDENISAIWAVRGGAGALRILDRINWEELEKRDLPVAGFSDITAIHWAMAAKGNHNYVAAPMMKFLCESGDRLTEDTLFDAFACKKKSLSLPALRQGNISGIPLPGNIAVAAALCGTEFFPDTTGKILILEDVGEAPYRIERMLTQLRLSGAFFRCAGVIFGNFTNCGTTEDIDAVLQDFTASVTCPVFYGLPFGHELPFFSLSGRQTISVIPQRQMIHAF